MEGLRLRVKDVSLERRTVMVRSGKGGKDRRVMLPEALLVEMKSHLERIEILWNRDREERVAGVYSPHHLLLRQASVSSRGFIALPFAGDVGEALRGGGDIVLWTKRPQGIFPRSELTVGEGHRQAVVEDEGSGEMDVVDGAPAGGILGGGNRLGLIAGARGFPLPDAYDDMLNADGGDDFVGGSLWVKDDHDVIGRGGEGVGREGLVDIVASVFLVEARAVLAFVRFGRARLAAVRDHDQDGRLGSSFWRPGRSLSIPG